MQSTYCVFTISTRVTMTMSVTTVSKVTIGTAATIITTGTKAIRKSRSC